MGDKLSFSMRKSTSKDAGGYLSARQPQCLSVDASKPSARLKKGFGAAIATSKLASRDTIEILASEAADAAVDVAAGPSTGTAASLPAVRRARTVRLEGQVVVSPASSSEVAISDVAVLRAR